jgi:prephenate dehydrogenase
MSQRLPMAQPVDAPPIFGKIAIVGLGLIGGSLALAVRQRWPSGLVIGVDRNDVLEKAMVLHAIDVAADDLVVVADADLVVLAAPVRENIRLLAQLPDHLAGEAVVTDVSSTKRAIVEAARALPAHLTFIGGHPLGGAARAGIEHARPDLFAGRPWLFTSPAHAGPQIERLFDFARALGAAPRSIEPAEHDRLLAYISHLPQVAASALMHVVGSGAGAEGLELSGRGLADTTRLASSPPEIWRDITATNADHLGFALDQLIDALQDLRRDLPASDALNRIFASATDWRARLK